MHPIGLKSVIFCLSLFLIFKKVHSQIPFTQDANGHILLQVKINGVNGKFIFDTGAGLNAIFTGFSKKIENIRSSDTIHGQRATGEELVLNLYNAQTITIGNKNFTGQQYAIIDLKAGDIDGIISLQPFKTTPVTIDYLQHLIFFNQDSQGFSSIPIECSVSPKILDIHTDVLLNNSIKAKVELDSGAGQHSYWFAKKYMDSLGLDKADFDSITVKSDFGKSNVNYKGKIKSLSTVNKIIAIQDLNVSFVEGLIYDGKTSIDWIGKILTIDIPQKKIFIKAR